MVRTQTVCFVLGDTLVSCFHKAQQADPQAAKDHPLTHTSPTEHVYFIYMDLDMYGYVDACVSVCVNFLLFQCK